MHLRSLPLRLFLLWLLIGFIVSYFLDSAVLAGMSSIFIVPALCIFAGFMANRSWPASRVWTDINLFICALLGIIVVGVIVIVVAGNRMAPQMLMDNPIE